MQTVHVRVDDSATGKPTPCRVRFTDAAGTYYAPLGRRRDFSGDLSAHGEGNLFDPGNVDGELWAHIDGACEIQLPPGRISVWIHKGIEYVPLTMSTELPAGKLAWRLGIQRWTDRRQSGWYSGDGRAHFASPHETLLQAAGEDLAFVNLLIEENLTGSMPNIVAFSGQQPCLERAGHAVVVNSHNVHPYWGSLGLLNCHRVVYPLRLGREGEADWTLADWCDQCHRKHGLVVWTDDDAAQSRLDTESLADLLLGKIDAFELTWAHHQSKEDIWASDWHTLLNAGLKMPLMGSSGSRSNGQMLGRPRTYAQLQPGEEPSYGNWIEAVRAGRSFVTAGPLLELTVDGRSPGSVIELANGRQTVSARASVQSPMLFQNVEIVCNGSVAAQASMNQGTFPLSADAGQEIPVAEGGWLAARCWGNQGLLACTSPVYVNVPGKVPQTRTQARQTLMDVLTTMLARDKPPVSKRLAHVLEGAVASV